MTDLCRRSYFGFCRGVCVSDLWRHSYIAVGKAVGDVSVSDLRRCNYIGVCRGGVCVSDLCRRSYFGFCRGGVCVSDLERPIMSSKVSAAYSVKRVKPECPARVRKRSVPDKRQASVSSKSVTKACQVRAPHKSVK